MDQKNFQEMIDFAIQREIESIHFYNQASKMVKTSGTKDLFLDLFEAGRRYKEKLEEWRRERSRWEGLRRFNLKISDLFVEAE